MWSAAVASVRRAAQRIGTGDATLFNSVGASSARIIPRRGTAEEVKHAHRFAAFGVVAPRSAVRSAALARADATAFRLAIAAAISGERALGARFIPLHIAAEHVDGADRFAAQAVKARRSVMRAAAIAQSRVAALRCISTHIERALRTDFIPRDDAAEHVRRIGAHCFTAHRICAARKIMLGEAIA